MLMDQTYAASGSLQSKMLITEAYTLGGFHAPITLSALQSLAGSILTALAELCQEQKFDVGWPAVTTVSLSGFTLLVGTLNGMPVSFTTWAMKKGGPVLVSVFGAIATVASALLAVIFLGDTIKIGSLPGMFVMFGGLYLVLWAKRNEKKGTPVTSPRKSLLMTVMQRSLSWQTKPHGISQLLNLNWSDSY